MKFNVENIRCGGCVKTVTAKLEALEGSSNIHVDLETASAEVDGVDAQTVIDTLTAAGYPATLAE